MPYANVFIFQCLYLSISNQDNLPILSQILYVLETIFDLPRTIPGYFFSLSESGLILFGASMCQIGEEVVDWFFFRFFCLN